MFLLWGSAFVRPTTVECRRIDPLKVKRVEWVDPLGREPTGFQQFRALQFPPTPLRVKSIKRFSPKSLQIPGVKDLLVAVVINADLHSQIQTSIDQYALDLLDEGYAVEQILWSGGDYEDLRDTLTDRWISSGLVGGLLVGDLPVAWCELNVWDPEEFPIDYYFMELDGTWSDSDSDGLLEGFSAGSGDLGPEIWVGRLAASSLVWGSEAQLLQNYFTKNHNYRIGNLSVSHRALSFVDDDWEDFGDCDLGYAYGNVTVITDVNQTIATNYKQRLMQDYEWIHLCAHSSCWAHTFKINYTQPGGGSVYNFEVHALRPRALFYNLFACSNTKFMETNNLGNWYIFVDNYGLLAIGSTKSGSMLDFFSFYNPLGQGNSIGEAFKQWFETQSWGGFEDWEQGWYFGMNVLGDPTLTIGAQTQAGQTGDSTETPDGCGTSAWSAAQVTTNQFTDGNPAMTSDPSGTIWATWESGRDIRSNIYSASYDGSSWSSAEPVVVRQYWDFHPNMATDSLGKVWVVWQSLTDHLGYYPNMDVSVSYHTPGGWSSPQIITAGGDYDVEPYMTADNQGRVWVVWKGWRTVDQNVNSNIFAIYHDGSWSSRMTVTSDLHDDSDPVAACDGSGRTWVIWSSNRNGNWDLYSAYYDNGTWSGLIPVTTDLDDDLAPAVASDASGSLWAAWHSWRDGDANIYASHNDGRGWSAEVQITSSAGDDIMPDLSADHSGQLALTWMSNRCGNWDAFTSLYSGSSWSPAEQVSSNLNSDYEPVCLFDQSGSPCFIWGSDRDGDWNVYFAADQFSPPDLLYPENLSYINDDTPRFEWYAGYRKSDATVSPSGITYTLQYSKDGSFLTDVTTVSDIPDQFYELPGGMNLDDTSYFWRVQAVNDAGDSSGYQIPRMFTVDTQAPQTPVLVYPEDGAFICDTTPTFLWSLAAPGLMKRALSQSEIILPAPERFTLQYSPDSQFTAEVITVDSLADIHYPVPNGQALNPDTSYYWRVRAFDLAGNQSSFQSQPFVFSMFISGDVNDDEIIDVGDVVYLTNYLYRGGLEPKPLQAGYINSDDVINVGDVVYLVSYLYRGGPLPTCD